LRTFQLLIDGGHLIRRIAFTPQGQLTTSNGDPSGLAHGFFSSLIYLSRQYAGNARAYVAFDSGVSKYRSDIYSDYKCKREDLTSPDYTGPDIHTAKKYIKAVLNIVGIPCFMVPGIEADDFIAALSYHFPEDTVVISSDQDFFQLVTDGVTMFDPIRKVTYDVDKIVGDTYDRDCWVDQYILHKCIIGDKDEVPSLVKGLGYVRALPLAKMLSYGCLLPTENKYAIGLLENLENLDRNIQLFDLQESYRVLKDEIIAGINSFVPSKYSGLELEHGVHTALSKWELNSVSRNITHLVNLRSTKPIEI